MTKNIALTTTQIELHVPDFEMAKDFYGKLGFGVIWEEPPNNQHGYLVMKREENILAFFCGNEKVYNHRFFKKFSKDTPRGYAVEIIVYVGDMSIEEFYSLLLNEAGDKYVMEPLKLQSWGKRDFRIIDPFGFYVRFSEPDNILAK